MSTGVYVTHTGSETRDVVFVSNLVINILRSASFAVCPLHSKTTTTKECCFAKENKRTKSLGFVCAGVEMKDKYGLTLFAREGKRSVPQCVSWAKQLYRSLNSTQNDKRLQNELGSGDAIGRRRKQKECRKDVECIEALHHTPQCPPSYRNATIVIHGSLLHHNVWSAGFSFSFAGLSPAPE